MRRMLCALATVDVDVDIDVAVDDDHALRLGSVPVPAARGGGSTRARLVRIARAYAREERRATSRATATDTRDAPIVARADYAVIGDLHEIVGAVVAELRASAP
ncbi:MAG: hypothetical protein ACRDON_10475 [Gaiellaceae bacterium]